MPYPMSFRDFARAYTDGVNALIALGSLPHLSVNKYADPTEGERRNLNMDEVRDIAAADPSLLFVDYRTDAELRAEYQSATAAYYLWTIIEDRLSDRERREKEAASARVDRAWAALPPARVAK